MNIAWQVKRFNELSIDTLYDIIKLRVDVFVVEQSCPYPELDELDRNKATLHLFCYHNGQISAYLRILPPGSIYTKALAIGRVVVTPQQRGRSLGHTLLNKALTLCNTHFPSQPIQISAQQHLKYFYQHHGFEQISAAYLEDNIPHIAMSLSQ